MKTLELKNTKELVFTPAGAEELSLSTYTLLRDIINTAPQGGFDVEEMMYRLKMRQLLDETNSRFQNSALAVSLQVEDADYAKLVTLARAMKWAFVSQFIVDFLNSL